MGLLSSIKSAVLKVGNVASSAAARVDAYLPHPSGGGLQNVVDVLKAPFTGTRVVANVKNPTLKKGLEAVSNNPFKTAGAAAVGVTAVRYAAPVAQKIITPVTKKTGALVSSAPSQAAKGGMISSAPSPPTMNGSPQSANGGIIKSTISTSRSPRSSSSKRRGVATRRRSPNGAKTRRKGRRQSRRPSYKRKKKKRYGTAKQYMRKGGKTPVFSKGRWHIVMPNGMWRFVKGPRK